MTIKAASRCEFVVVGYFAIVFILFGLFAVFEAPDAPETLGELFQPARVVRGAHAGHLARAHGRGRGAHDGGERAVQLHPRG